MATPSITMLADLRAARANLKAARDALAGALFTHRQKREALAEALRAFPADSTEVAAAEAALQDAETAVAIAREAESGEPESGPVGARPALAELIRTWLQDDVTHAPLGLEADIQRLGNFNVPVALFPARIETRFDLPGNRLKVRIYPDEFFSDIHERALLPEERTEGEKYWAGATDGESVALWTDLAARFGVPRAAYIVRATASGVAPPPPRASSPSRPAEAVLPDRWVVLAYKNGVRREPVVGLPIPEPLNLSPDPSDDVQTMVEVADGFMVPESIAWTVKYEVAKSQGMAVDIENLTSDEKATGFDRIVVIGVKTSMDRTDGANWIRDTFDGHHFTRGLDLVPQGTPTNNIPGRPTPFTTAEPSGAESFQTERVGADVGDTLPADWNFLTELFGPSFELEVFRFVQGAAPHLQDQTVPSQAMNTVLWPATLGYFMSQMMNPWSFLNDNGGAFFSDDTVAAAKNLFRFYVAAAGPAPAFRVGAVPYGVLPALSLSRWVPVSGEDPNAVNTMRRLLPHWQAAARTLPAVKRNSTDPKLDLMEVIQQKASSDGVFVRKSHGTRTGSDAMRMSGVERGSVLAVQAGITVPKLESLGHLEWLRARVAGLTFLANANRYAGPLVTASPVEGKLDPNDNYIAKLADAGLKLDDIETQDGAAGPAGQPKPLLYLLLRHALLLECVRIGKRLHPDVFFNDSLGKPRLEAEYWQIKGGDNRQSVFHSLRTLTSSVPPQPQLTVFERVKNDPLAEYFAFRFELLRLANLPVRELERMLTETLDLCSHRLDAWITSLATRRLGNYRARAEATATNFVGGYGWVEDVRPTMRTTKTVPGLGNADIQPGNAGFIHAPSMRHATPAAILRAGRMAEKGDATKYAIELPSKRTRDANRLIDAIRGGQSLGEMLGYEFERGMRRRNVPGPADVARYILALRKVFPQVANKSGQDGTEPADRIAARNVVDGKLLREKRLTIPWGTMGLPPNNAPPVPPHPGKVAIEAEIGHLDEIVDGLGDLLISETMMQIAGGDVTTAHASMAAFSSGENPPEPELTQSPSVGVGVSHRVVLLMEGDAEPPSTGWGTGSTLRGAADAFVDAWAGSMLGDPEEVGAKLAYKVDGQQAPTPFEVNLADLQIGPLDFVALAQGTSVSNQGSPLDRRLKTVLLATHSTATDVEITYNPPDEAVPSIPQLLEIARSIGAVLGGARELRAADLLRTDDPVVDDSPEMIDLANDLGETIVGTFSEISDTIAELDGSDSRSALKSAARFLADAFPDPDAGDAELQAAVLGASSELRRRLNDALDAIVDEDDASNAAKIEGAVTAFRTIFGKNTLAILPAAVPQGGFEIGQSLSALAAASPGNPDAAQAPGRYLQQAMRVRERLFPWRRLGLYTGVMGRPVPRVSAAQLPFTDGEGWVGSTVPIEARQSLIFVSASGQSAAPDPTQLWRGLVLDEWTEVVPGSKVETGLAFHYDSQNAEAPQVILMCVHSARSPGAGQPIVWTFAELEAIVNETIDLTQIRPVDSDKIDLGQLTPGILLAANLENKTVSTLFPPNALQDPPVIV